MHWLVVNVIFSFSTCAMQPHPHRARCALKWGCSHASWDAEPPGWHTGRQVTEHGMPLSLSFPTQHLLGAPGLPCPPQCRASLPPPQSRKVSIDKMAALGQHLE